MGMGAGVMGMGMDPSIMQGGMGIGMDPSMMQGGMGMDPSMLQGGMGMGSSDPLSAGAQAFFSGMMAILSATMLIQMIQLVKSVGQGAGAVGGGNPQFGGGSGGSGGPGTENFLGGQGGQASEAGHAHGSEDVGGATGNLVQRPGGKIDASIAGNFDRMVAAAKKDGVDLQIRSGHRSHQEQEVLYQKYLNGTGNLAAKPGTSNHEKGQAVDFANNRGAYAWLAKNATNFGFKNLPGEPWHYSPTGR